MTTSTASKLGLSLLLLLAAAVQAAQARIVLVVDGQAAGQEAAEGARTVAPGAEILALGEGKPALEGAPVVVAFGETAAQADYAGASGLVVALVNDPELKLGRSAVRVSSLPDAFQLMSTAHDLTPKLDALAVLCGRGHYQAFLKYLRAAGTVTGTKILLHEVSDAAGLVAALKDLPGKADAVWFAPEALLLKQENFKLAADFCRINRVALIAPAPVLARTGALAGVAPSFRDIGAAAGKAALSLAAGKDPGTTVMTGHCAVLINRGVAQSLGVKISPKMGDLTD